MNENSIIQESNGHDQTNLNTNLESSNTIDQDCKIIKKILAIKSKLKAKKSEQIKFSEPILYHIENPVFYPHTINVLQGQAGVHKSRLAETFCAAFLKVETCTEDHLGFIRAVAHQKYSVLYVDTERNLTEQLPYALQSIQIKSGYKIEDDPTDFDFISLLYFDRKDRFKTLSKYLNHYRSNFKDRPTFIVLDVSTDCIEDFNKSDKSMELIDHMNILINRYNVVFLCLIHENPGSEKARGHFGTELINKASTVMRVDFERDSKGPTDLIQVKYLKCRSNKKHQPFHIMYSEEKKGLVLVDIELVDQLKHDRQQTAKVTDILDYFIQNWNPETSIKKGDLINEIKEIVGGSTRTIETRLAALINHKTPLVLNKDNKCYNLSKTTRNKHIFYSLTAIN